MKIRTLVTGVGGGVGQGIIKSLKLIESVDIEIIAADIDPKATGLYLADTAILVPPANDLGYVDYIINVILEEKVNFYFPGTDLELLICAKNKEYIEERTGCKVHVSPEHVIDIGNDKYKTYLFLKKHQLIFPKTFLANEYIQSDDSLEFPVIVKPRVGYRSINVHEVKNESDLHSLLKDKDDWIVQEMAGPSDEEYTCTVVKIGKNISRPFLLKRSLRSGDTYKAELVRDENIESFLSDLSERLDIYGSCNFQLRKKDGLPFLFEINPRFSGTTPLLSLLGFNPVEYFIKVNCSLDFSYLVKDKKHVLRLWSDILVDNSEIDELIDSKKINPKTPIKSII